VPIHLNIQKCVNTAQISVPVTKNLLKHPESLEWRSRETMRGCSPAQL
jgi:hypothetical protein